MHDVDHFTAQNSLEVEITDLDPPEHASNALSERLRRMLLRWQRPERRRTRRWLSNGLLACLAFVLLGSLLTPSVGITALLTAHWPFPQAQPSFSVSSLSVSQVLAPVSNEIHCPVASAWSPNSSMVALLGYTQSCVQGQQYIPAQVDLYDAATTHQIAHWSPDVAILNVLASNPGVSQNMQNDLNRKPDYATSRSTEPVIHYIQMLWSPDHSRLALSFVVANYALTYAGLLLVAVDGSQPQVLIQPEYAGFVPNTTTPVLWDLQHGSATAFAALPPSLMYTWDMHDQLIPTVPLDALDSLPPGNPTGERSFTIWQPGHLTIQAASRYFWSTTFAAWSPDGRYFITNFTFIGLMDSPDQIGQNPSTLVPHLPVHDFALPFVAAQGQKVAWNPAGTLLAVYDQTGVVDIYNCQTGDLVRELTTLKTSSALAGSATLLSWSPDGHYMVLSTWQGPLLTLWRFA